MGGVSTAQEDSEGTTFNVALGLRAAIAPTQIVLRKDEGRERKKGLNGGGGTSRLFLGPQSDAMS